MMTADERGNFCGNSRLVRKLTHTIYGLYLQIAALEQRVHATRYRINSSHRECSYSSLFANMWAFCADKSEHFTRLAELQKGLVNRWKSLLCFSCCRGEVSHGKTKKIRFFIERRLSEEFKIWCVCLENVESDVEVWTIDTNGHAA